MKVYYKLIQKYNLNNHGKKASNSTKEVAVVTATLSGCFLPVPKDILSLRNCSQFVALMFYSSPTGAQTRS